MVQKRKLSLFSIASDVSHCAAVTVIIEAHTDVNWCSYIHHYAVDH